MNDKSLIIDADHRRAIHRQVIQHLSGIGDVYQAYAEGVITDAERFGAEYAEDLRLFEDLGWSPDDERRSFELTLSAEELVLILRRLESEAKEGLDEPEERRAAEEAAEVRTNYEHTAEVCAELMDRIREDAARLIEMIDLGPSASPRPS